MAKWISRRELLGWSAKISAGGLILNAAALKNAWAADKVCADMNIMDSSAKSLRTSLNYVEASPDPAKTCLTCGFFQGGADGCGSCTIFNGPANAKGHCDSWSLKG
jgi:High potential iron-sulfur protein